MWKMTVEYTEIPRSLLKHNLRQVLNMENISIHKDLLCLRILSHNSQICFLGTKNIGSAGLAATIQLIQVFYQVMKLIFILAYITLFISSTTLHSKQAIV